MLLFRPRVCPFVLAKYEIATICTTTEERTKGEEHILISSVRGFSATPAEAKAVNMRFLELRPRRADDDGDDLVRNR